MPSLRTAVLHGQPSWVFSSDTVTAAVTRLGGHLAPVTFRLGSKKVAPFSVAPWAGEPLDPDTPPILRVLRGDFFCSPFGAEEHPGRGRKLPPHGETANAPWKFESLRRDPAGVCLHLSLRTKARPGRVDKFLRLNHGETAIYSRHGLTGMRGKMTFGHHATLRFPDEEQCGRISTSRLQAGWTSPRFFEDPAQGGYNSLKPSARFQRLDRVPLAQGGYADLGRYPARRGFEDIVQIVHQDTPDFAWTAAAFPRQGYAWFSLKDPRVLQSSVFWLSNGGRHYAPWNGRHVNVMGLEDVTSYFPLGVSAGEKPNPVSRRGFRTVVWLDPKKPVWVNYIMAVAAIPRSFDRVEKILPGLKGVILVSPSGQRIPVKLNLPFLYNHPHETKRN
jgi:hypothetical protein